MSESNKAQPFMLDTLPDSRHGLHSFAETPFDGEGRLWVVGLLFQVAFNEALPRKIALIRKARPYWQNDRLNGLGGEVNKGESANEAMPREYLEEGDWIHNKWDPFAIISQRPEGKPPWAVVFYRGFTEMEIKLTKKTDEEPQVFDYVGILQRPDLVHNLQWLIPLALDPDHPFAHVRI